MRPLSSMRNLARQTADWKDIRRLQAWGYATVGVVGFAVGFAFGHPRWAMLIGVAYAIVLIALFRLRPITIRPRVWKARPGWIYLSNGPALYACVVAGVVLLAPRLGFPSYAPMGTLAVAVLSAFALGAASMFAAAKTAAEDDARQSRHS